MLHPLFEIEKDVFPPLLREIPQPPKQLWYRGALPDHTLSLLTVVGSRRYSTYGNQVLDHLINGLRGYPVGIVSGLALGIDALAHEAALRNNLYTLAVPGSGLNDKVLYPRTNRRLAMRILEAGGGLLSEFAPDTTAAQWTFPQRNRIMAGLTAATLVIEAGEKSGTLITARMTVDYNRELMVVPGSIFSKNTAGPHQFLKLGATPVTNAHDILEVLGIDTEQSATFQSSLPDTLTDQEKTLLSALHEPKDKDTLMRECALDITITNTTLMQLELQGRIKNEHGLYRTC